MKRKIILLISSILMIVGLTSWRIVIMQNYIDVDEKDIANGISNGFFAAEYDVYRYLFAAAVIAFIILIVALCFTDKDYPGSPRRSSTALAYVNVFYAALILVEIFIDLKEHVFNFWYYLNLALLICLFLFMLHYAKCLFSNKKIAKISTVVPLIYFVYKLCFAFINTFGIKKTSEITLHIAALVFCVLFFDFYARYTGHIRFRRARKMTLASGIIAVGLLVIACLPKFIVGTRSYPQDAFFLLCTAGYIALFLIISFSKKSLYRKYSEMQETEYDMIEEE